MEMGQGRENLATIGTGVYATNPRQTVLDSMCVADVEQGTREPNAHWRRQLNDTIAEGQRFQRRMVWGDNAKSVSGTALWTESAEPLPVLLSPNLKTSRRFLLSPSTLSCSKYLR